jgi:hypothetical protein
VDSQVSQKKRDLGHPLFRRTNRSRRAAIGGNSSLENAGFPVLGKSCQAPSRGDFEVNPLIRGEK